MSSTGEGSASARVADVLKSGLERHLLSSENAALAGHSNIIVTDKFEPGTAERADSQILMSWDDSKFEEFVQRLSEPQDAGAL